MTEHIVVPRAIREIMPDMIQETRLGYPQGSVRQYRHGRLHIREYNDAFVVHTDNKDPTQDPLGHLIHDAPEILAGVLAGGLVAIHSAKAVHAATGSKGTALVGGLAAGVLAGGLVTKLTKRFGDS